MKAPRGPRADAKRAARRAEARSDRARKLQDLRQDLTKHAGKIVVDRRGQAYEVQADGSIRRVALPPGQGPRG